MNSLETLKFLDVIYSEKYCFQSETAFAFWHSTIIVKSVTPYFSKLETKKIITPSTTYILNTIVGQRKEDLCASNFTSSRILL